MEYKSPTDYLSVDDFYKVIAYAYLFKGIEGQKSKGKKKIDSIKINEITISMVSKAEPEKLFKHLKENGYKVVSNNDGIYYISNGNLETQILVQKELSKTENEYLRVLTNQLDEKETLKQVMLEYDNESKNIAYRILLEVVTLANPNIVSEVMNEMRAQLTETNRAVLLNIAEELKLNKKWEEKGAITSRKEDILENLYELGDVDKETVKRINEEEDIATLKKWVKISARVDSVDEFKAVLFE